MVSATTAVFCSAQRSHRWSCRAAIAFIIGIPSASARMGIADSKNTISAMPPNASHEAMPIWLILAGMLLVSMRGSKDVSHQPSHGEEATNAVG